MTNSKSAFSRSWLVLTYSKRLSSTSMALEAKVIVAVLVQC